MTALLLCAREELCLAIRSRWTQTFAVVFAALALAVALSGYVLSGGSGVQDFARTAVSLVQLVVLLVPLTALLIGVLALAADRGAAELLYSQPVSRRTILAGKLLGLFEALVAAQGIGFGCAGLVIFSQAGGEGLGSFLLLAAGSVVLTAIFLGSGIVGTSRPGRSSTPTAPARPRAATKGQASCSASASRRWAARSGSAPGHCSIAPTAAPL
jgi:Cu-processing system permease protein